MTKHNFNKFQNKGRCKLVSTWLTHLRIAEKLKEKIHDVDLLYLMIGSIAPDSGVPNESDRIYTPTNEITHCIIQTGENESDMDITSFFNKYMLPEKIFLKSDKTRSFFWGYYFHLLTDKIWMDEYFKPFSKKYEEELENPKVDFIEYIGQEMDALDFVYLKSNGYEVLERFKGAETDLGFFIEFDPKCIYNCKKRIEKHYSGEAFLLKREFRYLNMNVMDEFVDKMVSQCMSILY
jgi:hypothetical protein